MVSRILGFDWTLAREASTSVEISRGLRSDVVQRLFVTVLAISLLSWVGHVRLALLWGVAVGLQESIDPLVASRLKNFSLSPLQRLLPFVVHNFVGCGIWAGLGFALWLSGHSASMFLGVALLIGILVHISVFYSVSRFQMLLNAAPIVATLGGIVLQTALAGDLTVTDKALIGVSVSVLAIYVMVAAWHNVKSNEHLRALIKQTERFAAEDSLTRLMNRRAFLEAVETSWKETDTICVAFLDLDRFKPINDEFGHAVGDEVLRRVGARLAGSANVACAARLGGDEFAALILPDRSDDSLEVIIDGLYSRVTAPIIVDSGELYIGASLGYAVSPRDGELVP
ncbi:MAG: GGDEF domain-containing protein, partial [Alphaproteobacteria bacterium]|nr:GGDEF domain-containing protein [Alphaproteobacteria bacterium]